MQLLGHYIKCSCIFDSCKSGHEASKASAICGALLMRKCHCRVLWMISDIATDDCTYNCITAKMLCPLFRVETKSTLELSCRNRASQM